jgi:hypothetical protein
MTHGDLGEIVKFDAAIVIRVHLSEHFVQLHKIKHVDHEVLHVFEFDVLQHA